MTAITPWGGGFHLPKESEAGWQRKAHKTERVRILSLTLLLL